MAKASPAFTQFNGGELSPFMQARIDLDKYQAGCGRLENFIPRVQGPAVKRSGTRFAHEARRSITNFYVSAALWGADVRSDGVKAVLNGGDFAGRDGGGTWRWAQKFSAIFPGTPLSVALIANVTSINTVTAGFDVGRYGATGQEDPQADSGATMFTRCANGGEYLNDDASMSTTGPKFMSLGNQAVIDLRAAAAGTGTFSVSARYANEAAAPNTGSVINEFNAGANAPTLAVVSLEDTAKDPVRLIPFEFSTDQAYVLEFGRGYMRVFKDGGIVLNAPKAITATTNATPVVVTSNAHGYANGDEVLIASTGIPALDGRYWYIRVINANTFELLGSTAPGSTSATGTVSKVFELVTPYTVSGDVSQLSYAQSADTLYLAHPNYPPAKITRTAHDAWTHSNINFSYFPFAPENLDEAVTIFSSDFTGSVTLSASSPLFTADMVGSYVKIRDIPESHNAPWDDDTDFNPAGSNPYTTFVSGGGALAIGDRVHREGRVYALSNKNGRTKSGAVPLTHEVGTETDGSWSFDFVNYGYGYAQITGITSSTFATANVVVSLPKVVTAAVFTTFRWSFGGWSAAKGYPRCVVFFEDRLWWGGIRSEPDTFYASRTGRYEDHRVTEEDDSAMVLQLNSDTVNAIEWMAANSVLQIGTSGGEWFSKESDDPLTPSNVASRFKQRSRYGARESVAPVLIENVILFAQRSGRKLRELTPPSSLDGVTNEAPDLTLLSDHLTTGKFKELSFQGEPSRILWSAMADGSLLAMTYDKAQSVSGWSRMTLGGTSVLAKSVATIPHPDGTQDQTWLVVSRLIGGATQQYIEILDPEWVPGAAISSAFFVDCGLSYSGAPTTSVGGLRHLEGQTVAVLADGRYVGTRVVSGGGITLTTAASVIHVGLPYAANLETMRVEAGAADGTAQGDQKRIITVVLRIYQTGKGLFIAPSHQDIDNGVRTDEVVSMEPYQSGGQSLEIVEGALFGGDTGPIPFPGPYEQKGRIALRHSTPLPCTISGIWPTMSNSDG